MPTALAFLAWFVFAPQCLATLATIRREGGGWRTDNAEVHFGGTQGDLISASVSRLRVRVPADAKPAVVTRLRKNMRLQTDPTVIYGLGATFDGNLRRRDLVPLLWRALQM